MFFFNLGYRFWQTVCKMLAKFFVTGEESITIVTFLPLLGNDVDVVNFGMGVITGLALEFGMAILALYLPEMKRSVKSSL